LLRHGCDACQHQDDGQEQEPVYRVIHLAILLKVDSVLLLLFFDLRAVRCFCLRRPVLQATSCPWNGEEAGGARPSDVSLKHNRLVSIAHTTNIYFATSGRRQ
jgi:hypothetical protein